MIPPRAGQDLILSESFHIEKFFLEYGLTLSLSAPLGPPQRAYNTPDSDASGSINDPWGFGRNPVTRTHAEADLYKIAHRSPISGQPG
jgi:hypothetical protein